MLAITHLLCYYYFGNPSYTWEGINMLSALRKPLFKRIFAVAVACGVLIPYCMFAQPCLATENPNVVMGVISDVHLSDSSSVAQEDVNLQKALTKFKENNANVIIVAGDISDLGTAGGYQKFNKIFDTVYPDVSSRPQKVLVMGNHDYYNNLAPADAQKRFSDNLNTDINTSIVVNGYHFIGVSTEAGDLNGKFTTDTKNWLTQELGKAVADDPSKPIFVTFHQPILNTVYESDAWGNASLDSVLKNYPQVVAFTGHTHAPLEDERCIYQKDYTCVATSTLSYVDLETGKINGDVPPRAHEVAQGLIVKVTNSKIDMQRYDFHHDCQIKNDWVVNLPVDKTKFTYTGARASASVAPYFPDGSKVTVSNVGESSCTVTFDAAKDADFVHSYKVEAVDTKSQKVTTSFLAFSDFYLGLPQMASTQTFDVNGLLPSTDYQLRVYAIESFGKISQPISASVTTSAATPTVDILNINFDKTGYQDTSSYNTPYEVKGNGSIGKDSLLNRNVLNLDGKTGYINYKINDEQLDKITGQFTLEAAFKMNSIRDQTVIENTEHAGLGYESTSGGRMELWVNIGSEYKKVGVQLQTSKYYDLISTYDGKSITLYLNGKQVDTVSASGPVHYDDKVDMCLGADPYEGGTSNTSTCLDGSIALIRIMNHGISSSEVADLSNAFFNPGSASSSSSSTSSAASQPSSSGPVSSTPVSSTPVSSSLVSSGSASSAVSSEASSSQGTSSVVPSAPASSSVSSSSGVSSAGNSSFPVSGAVSSGTPSSAKTSGTVSSAESSSSGETGSLSGASSGETPVSSESAGSASSAPEKNVHTGDAPAFPFALGALAAGAVLVLAKRRNK